MAGWLAGSHGSLRAPNLRDAVRAVLADDQAQQPATARQVADGAPLFDGDPTGDEPGDDALLIDDAQGRVLGAHQLANAVDNQLQHLLDLEHVRMPRTAASSACSAGGSKGLSGPTSASRSIGQG